ncbi:hypothetical protein PV749_09610 [Streptomyces sp. ID03-2B]|uniref:hypothetical protein n=1 Tax=Streptomyces sp. ID03-2B TaxID=3028660 RepID=UPI0029AEA29A|nr:hypothetical protein [Streptomyces sp. ID03-2B]MDX3591380.1 hypothetical protein [Streptomyces sp. ID03-2B]
MDFTWGDVLLVWVEQQIDRHVQQPRAEVVDRRVTVQRGGVVVACDSDVSA